MRIPSTWPRWITCGSSDESVELMIGCSLSFGLLLGQRRCYDGEMMNRDLQSRAAIGLKGGLFLVIGLMSAALLLIEHWSWRTALLLTLCVWGFCRFYFFAFYVIERWVDPGYKFSGLGSFLVWCFRRRK